jgi:hypothetical protein
MYLMLPGPDGRPVELSWPAWEHVRKRHPDLAGSLPEIVLTIEKPTYVEPDVKPGRQRLFRRVAGGRWIRVVLEFAGDFDRVVTAFPQTNDPRW